MREIKELRTRWQSYRQSLLKADYNHADEELARAIYFADNNAIIKSILHDIRVNPIYQKFDAEAWLTERSCAGTLGCGRTNLGFSLDEKERAGQCLKVLEYALNCYNTGKDGLWVVGRTTYGGSSSKLIDTTRSAIEVIFDPFYQYVDSELRTQESLITPSDIMNQMQTLVDNDASMRYPETQKLLMGAYRQLFSISAESTGEASWNQVGYACRHALLTFANEVFRPDYVPESEEQPKKDDAHSKLKWTARYHLKRKGVGDQYRKSIENIIKANWDFVNNVGHRQETATENDARLCVIYTYLTISAIDSTILHSE